jgi:hypothetical protein
LKPAEGATLCFPDGVRSCFACCPPIRPAGYEHVRYETMMKRVLRENTRAFRAEEREVRPITGFSCWALGYLDPACRLVGCLLHPARHHGEDLRYRVDFGEKCRRETCPEADAFDRLTPKDHAFWLHLADGLDAFAYSSRSRNPLFRVLNWGPTILRRIRRDAQGRGHRHSAASLERAYPILASSLPPRGWAYPVERLCALGGAGLLRKAETPELLESGLRSLILRIRREEAVPEPADAPHTHRLPMERSFLDFLRLTAGVRRLTPENAGMLKHRVDRTLERIAGSGDGSGGEEGHARRRPSGTPSAP